MKFNNLSHDEKLDIQKELLSIIDIMGGKNHFLGLIESVKELKQHPLLNKTAKYHYPTGIISWKKEIYKDKILAIKHFLIKNSEEDNLLNIKETKLQKNIINSIHTVGKLTFTIKTKDDKEYQIKPFNTINDKYIQLNTIFQIIFFDSINNTKKILSYK
ncbi:MAG: hypothetical protein U9Q30_04175 [Campylobacterota bacterium]|nr:hypothetical protein [Campylobacterota bacterium]